MSVEGSSFGTSKSECPSADERRRLLAKWNATEAEYSRSTCVGQLFETQVRQTPEAVAVEYEGASLSYEELNIRADWLAAHLRSLGVAPDSRVAVCATRSVNLVTAVLAVLKAGGAYVPLDPRFPSERLAFMLEDAKAAVLISETMLAGEIPKAARHTLCLDALNWTARTSPTSEERPDAQGQTPESLAYVIYTSGSTGKPKGVAMVHRPLVNLIEWQKRQSATLPVGARTLQFTSLSFDVSFQEIFSTWCSGGTLVLMPEDLRYDPSGLWRYLQEKRIHRLFLPFIALQQLAETASAANDVPISLCEVVTAGEQLQITPAIQAMFRKLPRTRLHNHYGPSETHVVTAYALPASVDEWMRLPPIGKPISNTKIYLLDEQRNLVPIGEPGELFVGGECLARGYLDRPELTAERFVTDPFQSEADARLYRTGDLARYRPDGNIEFLGRADDQVKLRGHRLELGEIEAVLMQHPAVRQCATAVHGEGEQKHLVAYVVPVVISEFSSGDLRRFLKERLANHMVPANYVALDKLPLTPSGKVNRRALPHPESTQTEPSRHFAVPRGQFEVSIARIWKELLQLTQLGTQDNFFDLGGNSLMLARMQRRLQDVLHRDVPIVTLFRFPTIEALARHLTESSAPAAGPNGPRNVSEGRAARSRGSETDSDRPLDGVAIVGMAGRFPRAKNVAEFWRNLTEGRECFTAFSDNELLETGVDPKTLKDPNYVRTRGVLDTVDLFDAGFFGYTRRDAEITDPQHRLFLECAWQALEDGGCDPTNFPGAIGVYAGSSLNTYFLGNVLSSRENVENFTRAFQVDQYNLLVGNDKDYLATRVAYKLDLRGPAVTVQTACSTSLVAVCQAYAGLLSHQCDLALAGGVSISFPQQRGYLYQEGAIASGDGHCRPFDARANGTVFGAGVAIVLLKRLSDAMADRDHIYAVIRGAAVNNDGAGKVSFSAPSVDGQARVIAMAHAQAGITADTIGFVEAHGTGTPLGDPIEVMALTQAFGLTTEKKQFCALGSVKGNVGHLEAAAGATGLIKAALALKHRIIPPTLHFRNPNPKCEFEKSPFYVAAEVVAWNEGNLPRRAGVSSFGVGGTNAHVVLEEAPTANIKKSARPAQLLVLSAKSEMALEKMSENLAAHLASGPQVALEDVAFTLQKGRKAFPHRRVVIAHDVAEATLKLKSLDAKAVFTGRTRAFEPSVVFLFPGQGTQYAGMGREMYQSEPVFKDTVDRCCEILTPILGLDLRRALYPPASQETEANERLRATALAQPALFVIEYALAKLWMSWGVQPAALAGHSIGEFVAAVLAEVMSLEDGLALLAERARLMQSMPEGAMLSVRLPEAEALPLLNDAVAVAVVNSPKLCVIAGPHEEIASLQRTLEERRVACKRLHTSHAFHSPMMEPIVELFTNRVRQVRLSPARIPIISTQTGQWINPDDWTDPAYWARQLRHPVRFAEAAATLAKEPQFILLEIGPGQVLTSLLLQQPDRPKEQLALASMPLVGRAEETSSLLMALGRSWLAGVHVDWRALHRHEQRQHVPLPTYPFERQRYWLESPAPKSTRYPALNAREVASSGANMNGHRSQSSNTGLDTTSPPPSDAPLEEVIWRQLKAMREQLDTFANASSKR